MLLNHTTCPTLIQTAAMFNGDFKLIYGFVVIFVWSLKVAVDCDFLDFTAKPVQSGRISNTSHFSENIQTVEKTTFYGCMELCKLTHGCRVVNYNRIERQCVMYSTSGQVTFSSTMDPDWVFADVVSTTFPPNRASCDPSSCDVDQYCRNITGLTMCLHFPKV